MMLALPLTKARACRRSELPISRLAFWLLPLLALLPPAALCASGDGGDGGDGSRPEQATKVSFPPFPQAENLIPFAVSATTENKFMIDGESLSVSPDRVVSYTLVIESPAGARNITYEAMRCATGERRLYALGRSDKTWSKARNDQWLPIKDNSLNRHYAELYSAYFCAIGVNLRDADDARRALRHGGHPSTKQH